MRTPAVVLMLASLLLAACEPVYWVDRNQFLDAQAGSPRVVRAVRNDDRSEVLLKPEALAHATAQGGDTDLRLRVKPPNPGRKAGAAMVGIGLGLATLGIVFGIVAAAPRTDCHDEECWLAPLIGGASSGALGGAMLLAGGITLGATSRSAELR